jgi:hypothetical protein
VQRRYLRFVERIADVCLYGLSHGCDSLVPVFWLVTQQPS